MFIVKIHELLELKPSNMMLNVNNNKNTYIFKEKLTNITMVVDLYQGFLVFNR